MTGTKDAWERTFAELTEPLPSKSIRLYWKELMRATRTRSAEDACGNWSMLADDRYFTLAAGFRFLDQALDREIKAEPLLLLAATFKDGMSRVRALCTTPIGLTYLSNRFGQIQSLGRCDLGVEPDDESRDGEDDFQEACLNRYDAWAAKHEGMNPQQAREAWTSAMRQTTLIIRMAHGARDAGMGGGAIISGIESILGSMITSAYAAFETLAGDLWIEAVNSDDKLAANWAEKNRDKQLTMQELAGHGFNLGGRMGTTLHQSKKVSFQSLSDIINVYRATFKGEAEVCFQPSLLISEAEQIRHLIAHRGGEVDRDFLNKLPKDSRFRELAPGTRLPLDGRVVCELLNALVDSAAKLLTLVDTKRPA